MEEWEEGTGESSSPPSGGGGLLVTRGALQEMFRREIYERLVSDGCVERSPMSRALLDKHFNRFPASYTLDLDADRACDVLLHQRILAECEDPDKRPVFHGRFLKSVPVDSPIDMTVNQLNKTSSSRENGDLLFELDEPHLRMKVLSINKASSITAGTRPMEATSSRRDIDVLLVHEVIFASVDQPRLLSKLSALLSNIGLNIREAHVFSTIDGFCLDVFVVDGWLEEETDGLIKKLKMQPLSLRNNVSLSNSSNSSASEQMLFLQEQLGDSEIDLNYLKVGEMIASGSSGNLHRGTYQGLDVAVKIFKTEHLNSSLQVEFCQEVMILRRVDHKNVIKFIGASTRSPEFFIVTEYMSGGNLYDFLHVSQHVLELSLVLRFAIDICRGMAYLHANNIVHRDLKTANLLIGSNQVVKVADFGVARYQHEGGDMTAETGTYRWMAPEVMNHRPYDVKADVFSFAIVLWELATSRIPYDRLTPLQAALVVREGARLDIPPSVDPRISSLIQCCWDGDPAKRPSFSGMLVMLEGLLKEVEGSAYDQKPSFFPQATTS